MRNPLAKAARQILPKDERAQSLPSEALATLAHEFEEDAIHARLTLDNGGEVRQLNEFVTSFSFTARSELQREVEGSFYHHRQYLIGRAREGVEEVFAQVDSIATYDRTVGVTITAVLTFPDATVSRLTAMKKVLGCTFEQVVIIPPEKLEQMYLQFKVFSETGNIERLTALLADIRADAITNLRTADGESVEIGGLEDAIAIITAGASNDLCRNCLMDCIYDLQPPISPEAVLCLVDLLPVCGAICATGVGIPICIECVAVVCVGCFAPDLAIMAGQLAACVFLECVWADNTAPYVIGRSHGVDPATDIVLYFSEAMSESSFDGNVHIEGASSGPLVFAGSYEPSSFSYTIDPVIDLLYGDTISVTVDREVRDLASNCLAEAYSFSFAIQDPPGGEPTAIYITSLTLSPSTVDPYGTVVVGGFAEYDTGVPVPAATATITVSGWDTWTAAVSNGAFSRPIQAPGNPSASPITRTVTVTVDDGDATVTPGSDSRTLTILGSGSASGYDFDRATSCVDVEGSEPYSPIDEKPVFSERDPQITIWVHLEYLYVPVKVRWEWYDPSGDYFATRYSNWTDDPQASGYEYWYDWWFWWWWSGLCDYEGLWRCEVSVKPEGGSYEVMDTVEFTLRYNLTEHRMCEGVEGAPDYDPIGPRNVFYTDDAHAYTWAKFINVADPLNLKWVYHSPEGQYAEFTHTTVDPWSEGYDWYDWYKTWGWIDIDGASAEYECGDWHVDVYVRDCYDNYELKYTDTFQIFERPAIAPSVTASGSPDPVIETQAVQLGVNASDANHLKRVVVHWNDGSPHTHTMSDNISSSTYSGSWSIGSSFVAGQQIEYWAEAWDESGNRGESSHHTLTVQPDFVSVPDQPAGPLYRQMDEVGTYTTGGSTTTLGNPVEYQFDWGDGTQSEWGSAVHSHAWSAEDFYVLTVRARSQVNPARVSTWSQAIVVIVDSTMPVVEIMTNDGVDFDTNGPQVVLEGIAEDALAGLESVSISTGDVNEGTPQAWRFTVDLDPGANPLSVTATDNAGNYALDTITITYVQDTEAPIVVSSSPGDDVIHYQACPINSNGVVIEFGEDVRGPGGIPLSAGDFEVDGSSAAIMNFTYDDVSYVVTFTHPGLADVAWHTIWVSGAIEDLAGNQLDGNTSGGAPGADDYWIDVGVFCADFQQDSDVDVFDRTQFLAAWTGGDVTADQQCDGDVDVFDRTQFLACWTDNNGLSIGPPPTH